MEKRIQIPLKLYEMMVNYIQDHFDPADTQRYWSIQRGIKSKQDAEIRRNLFSAYKTETDPETREILRTSYLDKAGIPSHGRCNEQAMRKFMDEFVDF